MTPSRIVWTRTDDRILFYLHQHEEGDTRRSIAREVGCSRLHAADRLDRMSADGIVTRRPAESSRSGAKPFVYTLTDAGRSRARIVPPQTISRREGNGGIA